MSNSNYITVTRDLVKRGWSDFEPKVIAGLLSGSVGAFLIPIAAGFGIHLSAIQANYAVIGFYFLGSYLTPSAGTTVTKTENTSSGMRSESETHSGNAVSVVTNSVPIQRPTPVVDDAPPGRYAGILANLPSANPDDTMHADDEQATTVLPPASTSFIR